MAGALHQRLACGRGCSSAPTALRFKYTCRTVALCACCRYNARERASLLEHLRLRPDAPWKASLSFSFKNEAKAYGSPMCDAAWAEVHGEDGASGLAAVLEDLQEAAVPWNTPKPSARRPRS